MLDSQQSDEQYMRELYERFLKGVLENDNSEFYDQDELLDIYDYAQDEGDEMTQLYVLLTGARLYPDSDFLDERKAFFLSSVSEEAARKMFSRKGRRDSALWQVLRLSLESYPDKNPEEGMADILSSDFKIPCEGVIRLIDMLRDLGRLDLLAENIHVIEEKCETPGVLYYEAAEAFSADEAYQPLARNLAEELTTREPFNPDNWVLLAKMEYTLGHKEESLAAVDYALAIDPANERARLMKGLCMIHSASEAKDGVKKTNTPDSADVHLDEGIEILKEILRVNPLNSLATKALSDAYIRKGNKEAALDVLATFLQADQANSFAIIDILRLDSTDPTNSLNVFDGYVGSSERQWVDVALQLDNEGLHEAAATLLGWFDEKYTLRDGFELYLQQLYKSRQYEEYTRIFTEAVQRQKSPGAYQYNFSTMSYTLLAASYLMSHEFESAHQVCDLVLAAPPAAGSIDDCVRWKGIQVVLSFIRNLAKEQNVVVNQPGFDPVCFQIGIS